MITDKMMSVSDTREVRTDDAFPIEYRTESFSLLNEGRSSMHWHGETEFFVARGGRISVQTTHQRILLEEGDGIIVCANTPHGYSLEESDSALCPNIVFSPELIAPQSGDVFRKYLLPLYYGDIPFIHLRKSVREEEEIVTIGRRIFSLFEGGGDSSCFELEVQSLLVQMSILLFKRIDMLPKSQDRPSDKELRKRVRDMTSYIDLNWNEKISLKDICRAAAVSKSEAERCFNSYMGCPPIEYLITKRINKAKAMLRDRSLSVKEIGHACGFYSDSYFVKVFRMRTGTTPREYRKTYDAKLHV